MIYRLNIQNFVTFFCFSALCHGNTRPYLYTGAEGGSGTINCLLTKTDQDTKFFCKETCQEGQILVKTDGFDANSGRYSIKYRSGLSGRGILSVTIANLTKSDLGAYRCGLGKDLTPTSYMDFRIRVSNELISRKDNFVHTIVEGETLTKPCLETLGGKRTFFCKDECKQEEDILVETDQRSAQTGRYSIEYREGSETELYVTISQVTKSDMGRYQCGAGRALAPDALYIFVLHVIDAPTTAKLTLTTSKTAQSSDSTIFKTTVQPENTGPLLLLGVCLLAGVSLVTVLLLLYIWRIRRTPSRNTEFPVIYENMASLHKPQDSIYQSLDPAIMDQNQIYSNPQECF